MTLVSSRLQTALHLPTIWVNGRLFEDPSEATVSVRDHGLVVGDGVFEALKVTSAGPFAVRRHLDRMDRSAAALGLPLPDHRLVREGIAAVLAGRTDAPARLRITYTNGVGPLGSQPAYGPPTLVVAVEAAAAPAPVSAVVTAPWSRNEHGALTGVKSTSYAENVRGLAYAVARGAGEAIFPNTAGNLCEGTGTNIFCVFGAEVVTPPLSSGPLAGITRELLLEWSEVTERDLTPAEARQADEVFLTSSQRDVQGVSRWDDRSYPLSRPITERLAQLFAERSGADLDP